MKMKQKERLSPTFIVAGVIVGLSLFVLLAMLFYGPLDYLESHKRLSDEDGVRFGVASLFFGSFGIGAYLGWGIILIWAVIVFFRESVGELALRGASLGAVVISGASLAEILGSGDNLGGNLGFAIGGVLEANLGPFLGIVLVGLILGFSLVLATDYGFISYYREAKSALAVVDEEEAVAPADDFITILDKTASEVEAESDREGEEMEDLLLTKPGPDEDQAAETGETTVEAEEPAEEVEEPASENEAPAEAAASAEETEAKVPVEPIALDPRPAIDEESFDDDLLVPAAELEPEKPEAEARVEMEMEEEVILDEEIDRGEVVSVVEDPTATPEPETPTNGWNTSRRLATALDTLLGPEDPSEAAEPVAAEPKAFEDPPIEEARSILIDDEIYIVEETVTIESDIETPPEEPEGRIIEVVTPEVEVEDEAAKPGILPATEQAFAEPPADEEREPEETGPDPVLIEEEPITVEVVVAEPEEEVEAAEAQVTETLLPFMEKERRGVLRSIFGRRKAKRKSRRGPDPLLDEAALLAIANGRASVVLLQRRLDIGHTRASRIVEALEKEGILGPLLESGSREVLMTRTEWENRKA